MGDEVKVPRLSPSIAHTLVSLSPLHAWQEHYLLGGGLDKEDTEAQARGRILDRLVFGVGPEIAIIEADDFRTKIAQAARDAAKEAGKIPVIASKLGEFRVAADRIVEKMAKKGVRLEGVSQARLEWESEGVLCKGKLDHLIMAEGVIWDLKTCGKASRQAIASSLEKYGGYIQHAAYVEAVETINPALAGRVRMGFVYCEFGLPYEVTVAYLDGTLRKLGETQWSQAKDAWRVCRATGNWPGYSDEPMVIEAKPWQLLDSIPAGGSTHVPF